MVPFGWSHDEGKSAMEKELDRIAEEGVKIVKSGGAASTSTPSSTTTSSEPQPTKKVTPAGKAEWSHGPYTTKAGVEGVLVKVGLFSAFIPNGDTEKRQALLDTINATRVNSDAMTAALRAVGCNL